MMHKVKKIRDQFFGQQRKDLSLDEPEPPEGVYKSTQSPRARICSYRESGASLDEPIGSQSSFSRPVVKREPLSSLSRNIARVEAEAVHGSPQNPHSVGILPPVSNGSFTSPQSPFVSSHLAGNFNKNVLTPTSSGRRKSTPAALDMALRTPEGRAAMEDLLKGGDHKNLVFGNYFPGSSMAGREAQAAYQASNERFKGRAIGAASSTASAESPRVGSALGHHHVTPPNPSNGGGGGSPSFVHMNSFNSNNSSSNSSNNSNNHNITTTTNSSLLLTNASNSHSSTLMISNALNSNPLNSMSSLPKLTSKLSSSHLHVDSDGRGSNYASNRLNSPSASPAPPHSPSVISATGSNSQFSSSSNYNFNSSNANINMNSGSAASISPYQHAHNAGSSSSLSSQHYYTSNSNISNNNNISNSSIGNGASPLLNSSPSLTRMPSAADRAAAAAAAAVLASTSTSSGMTSHYISSSNQAAAPELLRAYGSVGTPSSYPSPLNGGHNPIGSTGSVPLPSMLSVALESNAAPNAGIGGGGGGGGTNPHAGYLNNNNNNNNSSSNYNNPTPFSAAPHHRLSNASRSASFHHEPVNEMSSAANATTTTASSSAASTAPTSNASSSSNALSSSNSSNTQTTHAVVPPPPPPSSSQMVSFQDPSRSPSRSPSPSPSPPVVNASKTKIISMSPNLPASMARKHWCLADYNIVKKMYTGYASTVYQAMCKKSLEMVALKIYHLENLCELNHFQVFREVRIHSRLQHQNIIHLYATFQEGTDVVLVQEFASGGDLYRLLHRNGGRLAERQAVEMVLHPFLLALHFLHTSGVLHRDIKPENVLFTDQRVLKLADFGLAIDLNEERAVTRAGTLDYMAPEVLRCPPKNLPQENKTNASLFYSNGADAWAVGVFAFELVVGFPPFAGETQMDSVDRIMHSVPEFPEKTSDLARDFMTSALRKHPGDRPTVLDMLHHPWIRSYQRRTSMRLSVANRRRSSVVYNSVGAKGGGGGNGTGTTTTTTTTTTSNTTNHSHNHHSSNNNEDNNASNEPLLPDDVDPSELTPEEIEKMISKLQVAKQHALLVRDGAGGGTRASAAYYQI